RTPGAVVGVVCVRGRILTVLDPAAALNEPTKEWEQTLPYVLVLRGEDQLARPPESCRDTITISTEDIGPPTATADDAALGVVRYAGEEILILHAKRLFERAVHRKERRRRRF